MGMLFNTVIQIIVATTAPTTQDIKLDDEVVIQNPNITHEIITSSKSTLKKFENGNLKSTNKISCDIHTSLDDKFEMSELKDFTATFSVTDENNVEKLITVNNVDKINKSVDIEYDNTLFKMV